MGKQFKKYNFDTKKWELVPGNVSDSSVIKVLSGDSEINDSNIVVTNYNYTTSGNTTLNDTLTVISDDISRLQRNVSWLAEHGGGGGTGGGGSSSAYGIVLFDPDLQGGNSIYTKETSLVVRFAITGGTSADQLQYRYVFDGVFTSPYSGVASDEVRQIVISDIHMVSTSSTHTFKIEAVNPFGPIVPLSFRIYEETLTVKLDTERNKLTNNELLISRNSNVAYMYFKIKNGIIGADTTVVEELSTDSSKKYQVTYKNTSAEERLVQLDFWNLVDKDSVRTNDYYEVKIYAQSVFNEMPPTISDTLVIGVRITSYDEMLVYFDGLTYERDVEFGTKTATKFEEGGRLRFSFNVSIPSTVLNSTIYYAVSMSAPGSSEKIRITGDTETETAYNNPIGTAYQNITIQYPLTQYGVDEGYKVYVKAWSYNGELTAQTIGQFDIVTSHNEIFPRQFWKRSEVSSAKDTCFLSFNESSMYTEDGWKSHVTGYTPISIGTSTTIMYMVPKNTNGRDSGFVNPQVGSPYMRLQNEAYAEVNAQEYFQELSSLFVKEINGDGFTVSVTFKADESPTKEKTVFFWGANGVDGRLINGMKINVDSAEWVLNGDTTETVKTFIRQGIKNTVDFSYKNGIAYIHVNGILSASAEIGDFARDGGIRSNVFYFACDSVNNTLTRFSDVNIYDFSIYTKMLSALYIATNGKRARIDGNMDDEQTIAEYNNWKRLNLIYADEIDENIAHSYLLDDDGNFSYNHESFETIKEVSPIPIVVIDANAGGEFSREDFYKPYDDKSITATTFATQTEFYEPSTRKSVNFRTKISIQGTSTLAYRVKNLELIVDEDTSDEIPGKKKLFQPKANWFPEKEFTLKADVVDSSHANNATIGKWINECGIMSNNPPMDVFYANDTLRPKDVCNGVTYEHIDSRNNRDSIDFDENVTIKHNLEGFPIILFIKFAGESIPELIGIYSFNLGRFSYFNMGLSFLHSFSRRDKNAPAIESNCPSLVDYYDEYSRDESFGGIVPSNIFSYEFDSKADENASDYPTWSQNDLSILRAYGSFVFNGEAPGEAAGLEIWNKLSGLFYATATMSGQGLATRGFEPKYQFRYDPESNPPYINKGGQKYPENPDIVSTFGNNMDISNAVSYFMIANAFGMVDSLGKNLTLRTWDGGNKWWTCFYDMDTALGLTNEGSETVPETALIDKYQPGVKITENSGVVYHDRSSQYGNFNSKLWAIFRAPEFLYANNQGKPYYEAKWTEMRQSNKMLSSYSVFTDLMTQQVGSCGELLYDYDYNSKYVSDTQNLQMLHGLRVEYVRNWLKNRLYFLDGVFEDKNAAGAFVDSPFNMHKASITALWHQNSGAIGYIPYTFRTIANTFIKINEGNSLNPSKYYIPSYEDIDINGPEVTSTKQMIYGSSTLISKFDGINAVDFESMSDNNATNGTVLPTLIKFDISGTRFLKANSLPVQTLFKDPNGFSMLEEFDVSNTSIAAGQTETALTLNFQGFTKLKKINISNSDVSSIFFPSSILTYLNVKNSKITRFSLENQPRIESVDFSGCSKLQGVSLKVCENVTGITLEELQDLTGLTVSNCGSVEFVDVVNCRSMASLTISNNLNLKRIRLSSLNGLGNVAIDISMCPNLETLILNNLSSEQTISLDTATAASIKNLDMSDSFRFRGIKYNGGDVSTYNDYFVVDLSPMESLESASFVNNYDIKYVRVSNIEEGYPFRVTYSTFNGCAKLERVFGYIDICEAGAFKEKYNFFLNDLSEKNNGTYDYAKWHDADEIEFFEGDDVTNIVITTDSLESEFRSTKCNIGDLYYVFGKINSAVTSVERIFQQCSEITVNRWPKEEWLDRDFCKYCTGITNADYMLDGCDGISGYVLPEIISAITKSVTTFRNVFPDGLFYYFDTENPMFSDDNEIKHIEGFNPIFGDCVGYDDEEETFSTRGVPSKYLLNGLNNLESIKNSFNKTSDYSVQIAFCDQSGSELLTDSENFDSCELLRGKTKIKTISNSFNHITPSVWYSGVKNLICDPQHISEYSSGITTILNSFNIDGFDDFSVMFIGDHMFENCKNSIQTISNSFCGNIVRIIDTNDCTEDENGNVFPYRVFSGMTKIESVDSFFRNFYITPLTGYDPTDDEYYNEYPFERYKFNNLQTITLPSFKNANGVEEGMFDSTVNLKSVESLFKCLKRGYYKLSGFGFKNCALTNVASIFSEYESNQEISWAYEIEKAYKIDQIPYGLFYMENADGSIRRTIRNLSGAFEGTSGTLLKPYSIDVTSNDYTDYMYDGEWNIYMHDGTSALSQKISEFISLDPSLPAIPDEITANTSETQWDELTPDFVGFANGTTAYFNDVLRLIFAKRNYFCPPDIFRYCEDSDSVNIDNIFKTYVSEISDGASQSYKVKGYYGRIPSFIFWPITNLRSMNGVFSGMKLIIPEIWGSSHVENGVVVYTNGTMYPNLFERFTILAYISGIFENGKIYGYEYVSDIFSGSEYKAETVTMSSIWKNATWLPGSDIKVTLFSGFSKLENVSGIFMGSGPKTMYPSLFNESKNTINNCTQFMYSNATTNTGSVVQFWDFPKIRYIQGCYYGINQALDQGIPEEYKTRV